MCMSKLIMLLLCNFFLGIFILFSLICCFMCYHVISFIARNLGILLVELINVYLILVYT